jgi:hypothetical protein
MSHIEHRIGGERGQGGSSVIEALGKGDTCSDQLTERITPGD